MKKIIYSMLIISLLSTYFFVEQKNQIPEESIRFRIIPNSNEIKDQNLKEKIKKDLEENLFILVENSSSPEETEKIILDNKPLIESILSKYNIEYNINYGYNYFPEKKYKGIEYEEGQYKSLAIYIGEAKGNNWWCVMYPPLCLIDSNSSNQEDVEYDLYINKLINRLTK